MKKNMKIKDFHYKTLHNDFNLFLFYDFDLLHFIKDKN